MNEKLNGWNNNLTPLYGVGGKPGYHEKIATMTPEQQKAKEIVEKYLGILGTNCEHNSYCDRPECNKLGYTFCHVDYKTAKACAIEEVKAVLNLGLDKYLPDGGVHSPIGVGYYKNPIIVFHEKVLTEIEKL